MEDHVVDHDEAVMDGSKGSDDGVTSPLSDASLPDLLGTLVNDRGKVAAAEALVVIYRTMMSFYDSCRMHQRMRWKL